MKNANHAVKISASLLRLRITWTRDMLIKAHQNGTRNSNLVLMSFPLGYKDAQNVIIKRTRKANYNVLNAQKKVEENIHL